MPIQIWHAAASSQQAGELETACRQWLTDEEQQRAARFRQPTSQNQFVVGRGMTRQLLGRRLGVDPRSIGFQQSAHGKPHLDGSPAIEFNVAHTNGLVVVAIGNTRRLGVDVEGLDRRIDLDIAKRYFAASEVRWLAAQPAAAQTNAFLRIWTLKESFIKAIGTGLTMPLDQFAFRDLHSPHPQLFFTDEQLPSAQQWGPAEQWQSHVFQPQPNYIAALTVHSHQRPQLTTQPFV